MRQYFSATQGLSARQNATHEDSHMSHPEAKVRHDEDQQRYVLEIEGQALGFAQYRAEGKRMVFTHTEVDDSLSGQGMGSLLVRESLDDARRRGNQRPMDRTNRKIDQLRRQIPSFACEPGCHDCCGPVTASSEEMARLPHKSDAEHDAALAHWNCVHLGPHGCEAYDERPL